MSLSVPLPSGLSIPALRKAKRPRSYSTASRTPEIYKYTGPLAVEDTLLTESFSMAEQVREQTDFLINSTPVTSGRAESVALLNNYNEMVLKVNAAVIKAGKAVDKVFKQREKDAATLARQAKKEAGAKEDTVPLPAGLSDDEGSNDDSSDVLG